MTEENLREKLLKKTGAEIGDNIRIKKDDGRVYEGILMPHHEFSNRDVIVLKLKNGYNIGVKVSEGTEMQVLAKREKTKQKAARTVPYDSKKPTVSVLGTGGTIACYVDYRTGAVYPATTAEDLAFSVPEVFDVCNINARVVLQILSENITVENWQTLAKEIAEEFNKNKANGVVVPHGTDTMGYTSAALSFMLKNLTGPVVLVGAQRSSDRPSSDAAQNLLDAATVAANSDIGEVVVVMHGEISDSFTAIHRGTKVRKMHTSRRDAFQSINSDLIGRVSDGNIRIISDYTRKATGRVEVDAAMEKDVAMVYFYPDMKPEDIPSKKGIVLVGTGLGHVSKPLYSKIKELIEKGSTVVMTSQCIHGRVNMNVYATGRDLLKLGVIPGEDMLPETAYVKLMWVLAHAKNQEEIRKLMLTNIAGEISERTIYND
ncbi:MAG TPA: Glu-tRNA(Gln) amidotransferase subunit GatD [Thermoplasmatales archaeon]|nr:Glu-tRNA(Gln) amidotransferase subunit GatD [Thermoplasmatales archaeon]